MTEKRFASRKVQALHEAREEQQEEHEDQPTAVIMSAAEAERLTERIRLKLDTLATTYEAVMPLIREAIDGRAYVALGYANVSAYVSSRFGDALSRLGVDMRREVVRELTDAGMSTRAIAPVVGVSNYTVHQDQQAVRDLTPAPAKVAGLDGKEYSRPKPVEAEVIPIKIEVVDALGLGRPEPPPEHAPRAFGLPPKGPTADDERRMLDKINELLDALDRLDQLDYPTELEDIAMRCEKILDHYDFDEGGKRWAPWPDADPVQASEVPDGEH
jgi:hypothetical protein